MYRLQKLNSDQLNYDLMGLIRLSPTDIYYSQPKPPLVLSYKERYFWCEWDLPLNSMDCIVYAVDSVELLLSQFVNYHQIRTAHPVTQSVFMSRVRLFISETKLTKALISSFTHNQFHLEKMLRDISKLPVSLLKFMKDKQYALKQCAYFGRIDQDTMSQLCRWLLPYSPTATQFKRCCSFIVDISKRESIPIAQLIAEIEGNCVSEFITYLSTRYHPRLRNINTQLSLIRSEYHLPVTWDPTLEHTSLLISQSVSTTSEYNVLIHRLSQPKSAEGIQKLFDLL